ncbi:MAG TPA: tetratricopeptide repeat protein [Blastocatellia bacterium]|nr:tetratricopeptide repeat protein [Blastocatellia bacterium]
MKLREIIDYISGQGGGRIPRSAMPPDYACPDEADLLALTEDRLPRARRAVMEKHLAGCDDCRDTLTLFARRSGEGALDSSAPEMSEAEITRQAARVLAYIEQDQQNASSIRRPIAGQPSLAQSATRSGIYISFRQLAIASLLVCAMSASFLFWVTREQAPTGEAMQALALASSKKRRIEPRVSGDLNYSSYSTTRGMDEDDDLQFDIALNNATLAAEQSPTPEAKHILARVYLARGKRGEVEKAREILEQLVSDGHQSAAVLNDLGVAFLGLDKPAEAASVFSRALASDPGYDEALFNRALARQGFDREGARKDLEQFIKISTDQGWTGEAKRKLESLEDSPRR